MADTSLPPWLNVNARDFVNAASTGASIGLRRADQSQRADELQANTGLGYARLNQSANQAYAQLAQQAAQHADSVALQQQRLDQAEKETALHDTISREQLEKNFLLNQQKQSIAAQYQNARLSMDKEKLAERAAYGADMLKWRMGQLQLNQEKANQPTIKNAGGVLYNVGRAGTAIPITPQRQSAQAMDSVTEVYPKVSATDGTPADSGKRSFLGIDALWPDAAPTPATAGTPEIPERRITRKIPRGLGMSNSLPQSVTQAASSAPQVLPLPKDKKELLKDKIYNTSRGAATWDGENFVPVQ